jgi:Bacterial Ig-like domain (group 2)
MPSRGYMALCALPFLLLAFAAGCGGSGNPSVVLQSITVAPTNTTVAPGSSRPFAASGHFSDGSTEDLTTTVSWSSSHVSVATIDSAGVALAAGDGTTNIVAASSGVAGSTMLIVQSGTPDPLGIATAQTITCPAGGVTGTTCYSVTVACPNIADTNAGVKVTVPTGTSQGTVIFVGGGGGTGNYEGYTYGATIINDLVQAGYTAVQVSFPDLSLGWLTGPGGTRSLACRFATTTRWVYDQVHQGGATAPLCAHGESGGASAIAYSLSHYGMASFLSMVEPAGGPPFGRIDNGCLCNQPSVAGPCGSTLIPQCYEPEVQGFVDTTYAAPLCSSAAATGDTSNAALFLHESILSGADALLSFPNTDVHQLFGDLDLTAAVPEAYHWSQGITTKKVTECVADAGHSLPNFPNAAAKISSDLIAGCHLQ